MGGVTKNSTYSNVSSLVQDIARSISRDPETIIAQAPDVSRDQSLLPGGGSRSPVEASGIPVVQTELKHDPEARIDSILFMGYIYGEEKPAPLSSRQR